MQIETNWGSDGSILLRCTQTPSLTDNGQIYETIYNASSIASTGTKLCAAYSTCTILTEAQVKICHRHGHFCINNTAALRPPLARSITDDTCKGIVRIARRKTVRTKEKGSSAPLFLYRLQSSYLSSRISSALPSGFWPLREDQCLQITLLMPSSSRIYEPRYSHTLPLYTFCPQPEHSCDLLRQKQELSQLFCTSQDKLRLNYFNSLHH